MSEHGDDLSWPQGRTAGGGSFAIVGAVTGDSGALRQQSTYRVQVAAVRAAGREVGHYVFNGGDPATLARFAHSVIELGPNDPVFLDVETQSNRASAYTPAQALAFCVEFEALTGVRPGLYLNLSEVRREQWAPLISYGAVLWLAEYAPTEATVAGWAPVLWQYSSTPLDLDYCPTSLAHIRAMQNRPVPPTTDTATTEDEMRPTIVSDNKTGQLLLAGPIVFAYETPAQVKADLALKTPVALVSTEVFKKLAAHAIKY